ncbi:MAG TPA: response regulator, partial [Phenylobacterium sp.]|nr:response regulator [Phenylobacterium sp.]
MTDSVVHVIDDDEGMRDSLAFLLDTAGMTARTYESAVAFLGALDEAGGGVVVTDIRMPEMSGLELVRQLKSRGAAHPVIVITGHGDVPLAVEAMKSGVVDFLEKPFDDESLLSAI